MSNSKTVWIMLSLLLLPFASMNAEEAKKEEAKKEETQKPLDMEKVSLSLGHYFIRNLDISTSQLLVDKIIQGMKDEVAGKAAPLTDEEFQAAVVQIQVKQFQLKSQKNLKEAEEFLAKNAKEKGVVAINPKLQYKIAKEGSGEDVKKEGTPLINYTGKFIDGKVFSSTDATKTPVALPLKDTVPGVAQGIEGMKKGEKRIIFIHPDLAFGINSPFPPNSLVIFEVEVVEPVAPPSPKTEAAAPVEKKAEATAPAEKKAESTPPAEKKAETQAPKKEENATKPSEPKTKK